MSHGFAALRADLAAQQVFARVLWVASEVSNLLDGGAAAVQAIVNLARFHEWHGAPVETWQGGRGHPKALIHSLAQHLLGRYPVPRMMASAWFGDDSPDRDEERGWFIEHAGGRAFRKLTGLPLQLTRKMERILLKSPADLPVRAAIRRAELLALEAEPELVAAVLQTELATDLRHGAFWREALQWMIRRWDELAVQQVGPIVQYLRATYIGEGEGSAVPRFSGNSANTMWMQVCGWRREQALARLREQTAGSRAFRTWGAAGWAGLVLADDTGDPKVLQWEIGELLSSDVLRAEGRALRHCVGTYVRRCVRGISSIWSLRSAGRDGAPQSRFTIEVEPQTRRIVQIRGFANCRAAGLPLQIIARWARQEQLDLPEPA
ncbi:PcfJ domain-containing protein [Nannocystis bainbridge]|uniref:PcfJ domain-containing protein n=1 Tax=Nannocystis bainbridge TaxID=2995303 RepID=A0ABT5DV43_9BACT|nr:PcfJ domain-containing protein [Nannocystis bainbridge]MDC0717441.1 PcfJ domain-containing protein [Nannocystis bainbridge]